MKASGMEKGHLHILIRNRIRIGYAYGRGNKGVYDNYREVCSNNLSHIYL